MNKFILNQNAVYEKDVGILKRYNDNYFKLIYMSYLRRKGFEEIRQGSHIKGSAGNTRKLRPSLSRTKSTIYALAMCNEWQYFVTLTISKDKCDRYDLNQFIKKMGKWINNYNCRKEADIKYLLIPEPHKDNAWHLHGLIMGLPLNHLMLFNLENKLPDYIRNRLLAGFNIYDWPAYNQKFGFVTCEPIVNHDRCAGYITKYITKELLYSKIDLNHHSFYCSQNLKRPEIIHKGNMLKTFKPDFENDYVAIKQFSNAEEPLQYFE